MKFGRTKWCYKCGGMKMKTGGQSSGWGNTIGFGRIVEHRNVDKIPYFQDGGTTGMSEFIPSNNWQSPLTYGYAPQQNPMGSTTERALAEGKIFMVESEEGKTPYNPKKRNTPNWMGIGNAINFGIAGLAEFAGMYDRNMQQDYVNRMQNNPLSGILPFDDMRSDNVKEGYMMAKRGGKKLKHYKY